MSLLDFVILVLASYYITRLLVWEDGPFEVFEKLRGFAGVRYDESNRPYGDNVIADILSCPVCCSFWVTLGAVFIPQVLLLPFAVAGGVVLVGWR